MPEYGTRKQDDPRKENKEVVVKDSAEDTKANIKPEKNEAE